MCTQTGRNLVFVHSSLRRRKIIAERNKRPNNRPTRAMRMEPDVLVDPKRYDVINNGFIAR